MRARRVVVSLTLAAVAAIPAPTFAGPENHGPRGRPCSFWDLTNPLSAAVGVRYGIVSAGPLLAEAGGRLHCKIRVNVNSHAGGGVAADVHCDADSNGVILCATTVHYNSDEDDQDYLCDSYDKPNDGGTLYWHPYDNKGTLDPTDDERGHWTSDANKPCTPLSRSSYRVV